jgi:hypothetical protein
MGLFSWITQDTVRSIPSRYSERETFPVTMSDNKGNRWVETEYEGYGVFGGKDYYQLVAEMNGRATGDLESDRTIGIHLELGIGAIKHKTTGQVYKSRNVDFFNWSSDILPHGLSANDSLDTGDWEHVDIFEEGVLLPNLTENSKFEWVNEGPESCEHQGYFYPENDDDEDDDEDDY